MPLSKAMIRSIALIIGTAVFFAIISPYGAAITLPFLARLAYWLLLMALTVTADSLVRARLNKAERSETAIMTTLICAGVATLLVTPTILGVQWHIGDPVPGSFTGWLFLYVAVISLAVCTLITWLNPTNRVRPSTATDWLDAKLPAHLHDAELYALSAEDHYVRVHTAKGEALILMRLGDAEAALRGQDGVRTHRSWWVAKHGVKSLTRQGRNATLELKSGTRASVSRSGLKRLQDEGWI